MAKQLDEKPVGTAVHVNVGLLPERVAVHIWRVRARNSSVLYNRPERIECAAHVGYQRALDHERKDLGRSPDCQIVTLAVRRGVIERQTAFVDGVDLGDLRAVPDAAGHCEVGVASGFGEDLQLGIDTAEASAGGVGEREIAVNEGVAGSARSIFDGKTAMAIGEPVAVFDKNAARIFGGVGMREAVVEMDFDLSPTGVAMIRQYFDKTLVVLFGGIKVSVDEWTAIVITVVVDGFGILARPPFEAAFLLGAWNAVLTVLRVDRGLEMISQSDDYVRRTRSGGLRARSVADGKTFLA